jgi:hypothetical protein
MFEHVAHWTIACMKRSESEDEKKVKWIYIKHERKPAIYLGSLQK